MLGAVVSLSEHRFELLGPGFLVTLYCLFLKGLPLSNPFCAHLLVFPIVTWSTEFVLFCAGLERRVLKHLPRISLLG